MIYKAASNNRVVLQGLSAGVMFTTFAILVKCVSMLIYKQSTLKLMGNTCFGLKPNALKIQKLDCQSESQTLFT